MSVTEIKSDAYKLFEHIGDDDRTFWSMMRAMTEQYLATKNEDKTTEEEQLVNTIKFYSTIEEKERLLELKDKLELDILSTEEHNELGILINKTENYAAHRLKAVMELAKLRGVNIEKVLHEFAHLTYHHAT